MSAGTIALTNNSATAVGTGTAFTTDLKVGDFIVVIVGGVTYTLGVKSIESAASLTLIQNYGGPTASSLAWTAVPNATLVGITAQVAADVAKAIRGLNLDKANWQAVYSSSGNITVTLPDGSTFTGPSWSSIVTQISNKAAKGANSDITSLSGLTTPLSVAQGGTGAGTDATLVTKLRSIGVVNTGDVTETITPWITPTLQNSWTTTANAPMRFRKIAGLLTLQGYLQGGTNTDGTLLFTLPAGYRPTAVFIHIPIYGQSLGINQSTPRIYINNGGVYINNNANSNGIGICVVVDLGQ